MMSQQTPPNLGGKVSRRDFVQLAMLAGFARELNTSLFVSRGVGTVYVPVRISCPPDVAVLTLRPTSPV